MIVEQHTRGRDRGGRPAGGAGLVFDTSLALADVRMNTVMKKLTAWAAIIAVPTLDHRFAG
jgi:magnesium transporter